MEERRYSTASVIVVIVVVAVLAAGSFAWGLMTGWNTAEPELVVEKVEVPVVKTIEVPVVQTVEVPQIQIVEKPCVVTCPCEEPPCVEPCKPCGVPEVPTVIPKATPTPKEPGCPSEFGDHPLKKEQSWQVPDCWTCLGDIEVEGEKLYDNIAETGLVVYFSEGAEIYAPWGANCISGDRRAEKKVEALASGCMGPPEGCKEVIIIVWPQEPN